MNDDVSRWIRFFFGLVVVVLGEKAEELKKTRSLLPWFERIS